MADALLDTKSRDNEDRLSCFLTQGAQHRPKKQPCRCLLQRCDSAQRSYLTNHVPTNLGSGTLFLQPYDTQCAQHDDTERMKRLPSTCRKWLAGLLSECAQATCHFFLAPFFLPCCFLMCFGVFCFRPLPVFFLDLLLVRLAGLLAQRRIALRPGLPLVITAAAVRVAAIALTAIHRHAVDVGPTSLPAITRTHDISAKTKKEYVFSSK